GSRAAQARARSRRARGFRWQVSAWQFSFAAPFPLIDRGSRKSTDVINRAIRRAAVSGNAAPAPAAPGSGRARRTPGPPLFDRAAGKGRPAPHAPGGNRQARRVSAADPPAPGLPPDRRASLPRPHDSAPPPAMDPPVRGHRRDPRSAANRYLTRALLPRARLISPPEWCRHRSGASRARARPAPRPLRSAHGSIAGGPAPPAGRDRPTAQFAPRAATRAAA